MNRLLLAMVGASMAACSAPVEPAQVEAPKPDAGAGAVLLTQKQVQDAQLATEKVIAKDLSTEVLTSGRIAFDDLKVEHVYSPVSGHVTHILANLGAKVKKGDGLATIESPDVGSALSDLGKAQADLVASEHELRRQEELVAGHAGAQRDLETAQDNFGKAKAEMERAQARAQLLRRGSKGDVLQGYTLRSLIDGEVISRSVNPGAEVQGQYSGGTAVELFTVGQIDEVWVLADIFEMDLNKVKLGQKMTVRLAAYPEREFPCAVDWVSDALDPATRTGKARCTLTNGDPKTLLKPEMYASVTIEGPISHALAVKRSAVVRLGEQTLVFVQTGAGPNNTVRFEPRVVKIDEQLGRTYVPVLQRLDRG